MGNILNTTNFIVTRIKPFERCFKDFKKGKAPLIRHFDVYNLSGAIKHN